MKKALLLLFPLAPLFLFSQQIHYVKSDATGANNGLNWQDAFTDLQSALQFADYGDDIWVAAGTYKPTQGNDRTVTFDLPVGVRLAGGFTGMEALFGERDWANNITLLSGDIGNPDVWEDNSHHIVRVYGADSLTVLDGFKIMHGRADEYDAVSPKPYGGGVLVWANLEKTESIPLIQNCTFEHNYAYFGSGIACLGQFEGHIAAPAVKNCKFVLNRAQSEGAGLYKRGNCLAYRSFLIEDCEFKDNYSFQYGGGLAVINFAGNVDLKRNRFISDTSYIAGGAVYFSTAYQAEYLIDQCDFSYNRTGSNGGAISRNDFPNGHPVIRIQNSNFNSNTAGGQGAGAFDSSSFGFLPEEEYIIDNCRMENNEGGAVHITTASGASDVRIDRSYFYGNKFTNGNDAGGYHYYSVGNADFQHHSVITNSVFAFNEGAISNSESGNNSGTIETTIANCTFFNNGLTPFYKHWSANPGTMGNNPKMNILNSIIWEEETPDIQHLFYNRDAYDFSVTVNNYEIEHCLLNFPGCVYDDVNPCGTGMLYETAPQFVSTDLAMPDLSVPVGSPVVNKGSNTVADTFGLLYDYLGNPRILQDTVDMGAYETDASSSVFDPFFEKESFLLQTTPNILSIGQPIQIQLFNLGGPKTFVIRLTGVDGRELYWQMVDHQVTQVPVEYILPSTGFVAGVYWLSVEDSEGRRKTGKVILR